MANDGTPQHLHLQRGGCRLWRRQVSPSARKPTVLQSGKRECAIFRQDHAHLSGPPKAMQGPGGDQGAWLGAAVAPLQPPAPSGDILAAALSDTYLEAAAQGSGQAGAAGVVLGGGPPLGDWSAAALGAPLDAALDAALPAISGLRFGAIDALGGFSGVSGAMGSLEGGDSGAATTDTAAAAAAPPPRRRGGRPAHASEEERQEHVRALNRAKQARWRERRKVGRRRRVPAEQGRRRRWTLPQLLPAPSPASPSALDALLSLPRRAMLPCAVPCCAVLRRAVRRSGRRRWRSGARRRRRRWSGSAP